MTGGIVVLLSCTLLALAQPAATPPPELRLPEKALAEENVHVRHLHSRGHAVEGAGAVSA